MNEHLKWSSVPSLLSLIFQEMWHNSRSLSHTRAQKMWKTPSFLWEITAGGFLTNRRHQRPLPSSSGFSINSPFLPPKGENFQPPFLAPKTLSCWRRRMKHPPDLLLLPFPNKINTWEELTFSHTIFLLISKCALHSISPNPKTKAEKQALQGRAHHVQHAHIPPPSRLTGNWGSKGRRRKTTSQSKGKEGGRTNTI